MTALRVGLLFGLVLHKLVWELLKRRDPGLSGPSGPAAPPAKRLLKGIKALLLVCLAIQTLFLDLFPIAERPAALRVVGTSLYVVGLSIAVAGRVQLGPNWVDLEDARIRPGQSLVAHGLYRYVRHPIYAGDLLLLIGLELALNSWLVLGALIPLVVVLRQAAEEETLLARAFPDYGAYRAGTKRFIPFVL